MIRKLRIKLTVAFMLSFLAVLLVIMSTVNVLNFISIVNEADKTLSLLEINDGRFPIKFDKPAGQKGPGKGMSPELPYESRFFSVLLSEDGEVISTDIDHVAAIDSQSAQELSQQAVKSGKRRGFSGNYRYSVIGVEGGFRVIFLDCTRSLSTFKTFLIASVAISLTGSLAVLALIVIFSGRIVKPVSESYEKQKGFITDAGHEIKTPITIIDADAEVLEMELGENEWLQDIRKQTRRLGDLTNDLIYLSRMEEENMKLQTIEFPISDLVSETAQSFQALAKTQSIDFAVNIEPMLSLNGDEKAIGQLVCILLDNALKYSDKNGKVSLLLKKQGKTVVLQVHNTAENVTKEMLSRLFDRFYRADTSRSSSTGGYGIGLSIAKAVVTAHKGRIVASSSDFKSLNITVTLPM